MFFDPEIMKLNGQIFSRTSIKTMEMEPVRPWEIQCIFKFKRALKQAKINFIDFHLLNPCNFLSKNLKTK